jgi:hypothetical protein
MKDMNRDELIEVIAAVSFRVTGLVYAFAAFYDLFHLLSDRTYFESEGRTPSPYDLHILQLYTMDALYHALLATLMFILTVPLARLVCRGLSLALDLKPSPSA